MIAMIAIIAIGAAAIGAVIGWAMRDYTAHRDCHRAYSAGIAEGYRLGSEPDPVTTAAQRRRARLARVAFLEACE